MKMFYFYCGCQVFKKFPQIQSMKMAKTLIKQGFYDIFGNYGIRK